MKIVVIHEDNHGQIGVALNYYHAVRWLIENQWLDNTTEICFGNTWKIISSVFGSNWKDLFLYNWDINVFNSIFSGCFYLEEVEVYGTEMD